MTNIWMRYDSADDGTRSTNNMLTNTWWTSESVQIIKKSYNAAGVETVTDVTNDLGAQANAQLCVRATLRNLGPSDVVAPGFHAYVASCSVIMDHNTDLQALGMIVSPQLTKIQLGPSTHVTPCTAQAPGAGTVLDSNPFDGSLLTNLDQAAVGVHAWAQSNGGDLNTLEDWNAKTQLCDGLRSVAVVTSGGMHIPDVHFHYTAGPAFPKPNGDPPFAEVWSRPESVALEGGTRAALNSAAGVEYVRATANLMPALLRGLRLAGREPTLRLGSTHFALRVDDQTLVPLRFPRGAPYRFGLSNPTLGEGRVLKLPYKHGEITTVRFRMQFDEGNRPGDAFFFDVVKREPKTSMIGAATRLVVIAGV